ncbi:hypothetical protein BRADI_3g39675v3 [Brachypodium distachyon]|uniref:Uncharacterized protein n=1 Tax=Brachypodium distachyon TaxID=15368 RepID=A0A2K2D256_BRADI|nr:hypothetical protein BRADI_3g39675v3 [Brachypodium distachyon]
MERAACAGGGGGCSACRDCPCNLLRRIEKRVVRAAAPLASGGVDWAQVCGGGDPRSPEVEAAAAAPTPP